MANFNHVKATTKEIAEVNGNKVNTVIFCEEDRGIYLQENDTVKRYGVIIEDNLESGSEDNALSARQGKVLNDKVLNAIDKVDVARWLRPEIFQMEDTNDCINFLFLDEITAAPQSVQAAAYQLVLDRKVGEHKLPNNCYVFCAGNRVTDKSVAYKMPKALANRMCHLEIYADIDDWKKWAFNAGIDSRIIGFLNFKNEALFMFDPAKDDLAYPTPRTWAMVDNFLKKIPNIEACLPLISGAVGVGVATEFFGYAKVYSSLPDIDGIFAGKNVPYPSKMDVNYALSSSLVTKALKANKKQVNNMITWLNDWEPDYAVLTIMDCVKTTKLKQMIIDLPAWITWYKNHRELVVNL